jgi:hypothetical protein
MTPKKKTRKQILKELDQTQQNYTRAIYSIMEIRHAVGDENAELSHQELVEKIKELNDK